MIVLNFCEICENPLSKAEKMEYGSECAVCRANLKEAIRKMLNRGIHHWPESLYQMELERLTRSMEISQELGLDEIVGMYKKMLEEFKQARAAE